MHKIQESIVINAPPDKVWEVVSDLASYAQWNTFVVDAKLHTDLSVGAQTTITVKIKPDGKPTDYHNTISKIVSEGSRRELVWGGALGAKIIFDTEHYLHVSAGPDNNSCKFEQGETFTGMLVPLIKFSSTFNDLQDGYSRMNQDLKKFVETSRH